MSKKNSFDFVSFKAANADRIVTGFDYLHAVYKSQGLAPDFILWLAKLFWPDLKKVDGIVFISELFNADRYNELLGNGHSYTQAQFWMNLIEVTGLFDDLPTDQAIVIAESIANSWNSKLQNEFGISSAPAKAIYDNETEEVFVTIGNSD